MRTKYKNRHDKNKTPSRIYKPCLTAAHMPLPLTQAEKKHSCFPKPTACRKQECKNLNIKNTCVRYSAGFFRMADRRLNHRRQRSPLERQPVLKERTVRQRQ